MKKPQWITLGAALLLVVGLYAATQDKLFGNRPAKPNTSAVHSADDGHNHGTSTVAVSTDSILYYAKKGLPQQQVAYLTGLENSVVRGDVAEQKLHLAHRLARYWRDSARAFTPMAWYPYAYYTAEAARLENSGESLSFAAHLFLAAIGSEENAGAKQWEAEQARDLFQRSLKQEPDNDSSKVGLGATLLYGGLESPMTAIAMIRDVVQKDSTNAFAQTTLGEASVMSGQLDKAVERFATVVRLKPDDLKAGLLLADTYERMGKKPEAAGAYKRLLPYAAVPQLKTEIEKRVTQLQTK